jgi:hypothetical protein
MPEFSGLSVVHPRSDATIAGAFMHHDTRPELHDDSCMHTSANVAFTRLAVPVHADDVGSIFVGA